MTLTDTLSSTIETALSTGRISAENLGLVMAFSGLSPYSYDDCLAWLIDRYDLRETDISTMEGRASGWKEVFRAWSRGTFDTIHIKDINDGIPLDEVKSFFNKLDIKRPELLFPDRGLTPWLFPELDYEKLSATALKWAKEYPFIERIRLYKNSGQAGNDGRYLLIFETFDPTEYTGTFEDYDFREHFLEGPLPGSDFEEDLKTVFHEGYTPPLFLSEHWRPLFVQPGESVFDQEAPPPYNTESGINEQTHWVLYGQQCNEGEISLGELIRNAKLMGRIADIHLFQVFSNELWFTQKHLPYLWKRFGCDRAGGVGDLSRVGYRYNRWSLFFNRIMYGCVDPGTRPHIHNGFDPDHIEYSRDKNGVHFKIDDLRAYFMKWAADIPFDEFPELLKCIEQNKADSLSADVSITELKTDPSAPGQRIEKCRRFVQDEENKRIRDKKPVVTAGEYYSHAREKGLTLLKNGKDISPKVFTGYVSDILNPSGKTGPLSGSKRQEKRA